MTAPSGEQIEIAHGEQRAVVVEVGGGLRAYSSGGHDVLDGYDAGEMCSAGRGQVLLPWPNRIADGRYRWEGEEHQLALTQPGEQNAIHGLVRWVPWRVAQREGSRVVMEHVLHPRPGYPFALSLSLEYVLSADGLEVRTRATNVGDRPCPYGAGAHPYLTVGTATVDPVMLSAPARTVLQADGRGIPTGSLPVEGSEYDFRTPRPIGPTRLDHCFTDLERDGDGRARVELRDGAGRSVVLWADEAYGYLMLFTGDPLPDVDRRSLAVEPMTCPPNAFATGEAVIRLAPGDSHAAAWGITPAG